MNERSAPKDVNSELQALAALGFVSSASVMSGGTECGPTDPTEADHPRAPALALTYGPMSSTEDADVLQLLDGSRWPPTQRS